MATRAPSTAFPNAARREDVLHVDRQMHGIGDWFNGASGILHPLPWFPQWPAPKPQSLSPRLKPKALPRASALRRERFWEPGVHVPLTRFGGRMSKDLDRRVKAALDETRLLILGVQVLLGFEFQCFFQDGFSNLSLSSKFICMVSLYLVIVSTGVLVIPSMQHRLVESGRSTLRLVRATNVSAGLGLAPLTASLGLSTYVVIDRHFGMRAGIASGLALTWLAAFAWFGLELLIGSSTGGTQMETPRTPLATKIDQMLTETRVIIPGAQALFGFQLVAMLTTGFERLPEHAKLVHAAALCLIAVNVILLITPAALHRLSFGGEDSVSFLRIGSAFVIAAPLFLAGGIALEAYVVMQKAEASQGWAAIAAGASFLVLFGLWYALPLALRYGARQ